MHRLGMEWRELIGGIRLEAEELPAAVRPGRARRMRLIRAERTRDDAAVAEPVKDRATAIDLDPARDVRMMPAHDIGARIDRGVGERNLVGRQRWQACATMPL